MAPVEGSPVRVPLSILDKGSAMWAVIGIMDALRRRDASGAGSYVETSLLQTAMSWISVQLIGAVAGNERRESLGSGHDGVVPYGAFPVQDGHIFMSAGNQALWLKFLTATGETDLNSEPGFSSNPERAAHRSLVNARVSEITSRYGADELLRLLSSHDVPASMVNRVEDMVADEQVAQTGIIESVEHPSIEGFKVVNIPVTINGEYPAHTRPAPRLGASSREVVQQIGRSADEIDRLVSLGIIGVSSEEGSGK
jgi:crotonobetainyl-CoA:carnitine CoA-transferase CaiB-like acyl-CoA transferase